MALIGAGRLARSLIPWLTRGGYRLTGIAASSPASARRACRGIRGVRATTNLQSAVRDAQLVLLAVPDRSIAAVARRLAALPGFDWNGRAVLHHAGALGPEVLEPLARSGAFTGVLHPLQCLGRPDLARVVLPGSWARIEGQPRARSAALALASTLGLIPLPMRRVWSSADRATYHAAAALAANDVVALWSVAHELFVSIGIRPGQARAALAHLTRGTVEHLERHGISAALTGPAARGDRATIAAHLTRLAQHSREDAEVHRLLSRRLRRLRLGDSRLSGTGD